MIYFTLLLFFTSSFASDPEPGKRIPRHSIVLRERLPSEDDLSARFRGDGYEYFVLVVRKKNAYTVQINYRNLVAADGKSLTFRSAALAKRAGINYVEELLKTRHHVG
jgi:hypothetical protein